MRVRQNMRRWGRLFATTGVVTFAIACGGGGGDGGGGGVTPPPPTRVPASVTFEGGTTVSGTVGTAIGTTIAVTVRTADNLPVPSTTVTFSVSAGIDRHHVGADRRERSGERRHLDARKYQRDADAHRDRRGRRVHSSRPPRLQGRRRSWRSSLPFPARCALATSSPPRRRCARATSSTTSSTARERSSP